MAPIIPSGDAPRTKRTARNEQDEVRQRLVAIVGKVVNGQLTQFVTQVFDALMQFSDACMEPKQASASFNAANLLKKNAYAFHFLITGRLQEAVEREFDALKAVKPARAKKEEALELVPFADMEKRLLLSNMARPIETAHAKQLTALRLRIARLLGREELSNNQNPLRPDILLDATDGAWREFNPDADAHTVLLPLLRPEIFFDLAPLYLALNNELISSGVLTELSDTYNIKKTTDNQESRKKAARLDPEALQQLRQMLSPQAENTGASAAAGMSMPAAMPMIPMIPTIPGLPTMPLIPGLSNGGPVGNGPISGPMNGPYESIGAAFAPASPSQPQSQTQSPAAMSTEQLMSLLAGLQKNLFAQQAAPGVAASAAGAMAGLATGAVAGGPTFGPAAFGPAVSLADLSAGASTSVLTNIKTSVPQGALTRVDESTIDLLTKIFDVVFRDQNIPSDIKGLIGFLQVPVLKAALADKEFFFQEEHPARRVIDLLTKTSVGWDRSKGHEDPLFQAIKRSVDKIQQEFDHQALIFSDVVAELEAFIAQEETAATAALSEPIALALRQEKIGEATKAAKNDVAMRIGTGEVVAFVETFLENKWVPVLTLAYSMREEKPHALESALKTMDDLIWSVKPKITAEERKELIAKLPSMLAMLNKWLDLVKLDDAERLQFFAELAECHASIVRAPLEMSPQRRLEIAMEVAKEAAERRLQKKQREQELQQQQELQQAQQAAAEETSDDAAHVDNLERGMWLEFTEPDAAPRKVKLSWISPLRSLYIFSNRDKSESFSLSADALTQALREGRAKVILLAGLVDRAIAEALEHSANDADIDQKSVA